MEDCVMNTHLQYLPGLLVIATTLVSGCGSSGGEAIPNLAPEASDGTLILDRNDSAGGTLEAVDPEDGDLTFTIVDNGNLGSATITDASTGAYTYTPDADAYGNDQFTFKASDSIQDSNTATVSVTINPAFRINTSGGRGGSNGGMGGPAGPVISNLQAGNSNLYIRNSGLVDAGFEPGTPFVSLGDNPLVLTENTTINTVTMEPAAGTAYQLDGSGIVRISDGNGTLKDEAPVTGIDVGPGTVLTLDLNSDMNTRANLALSHDLHNQGTITTLNTAANTRGGIILEVAQYIANSEIDTAGTATTPDGGDVHIFAQYSIYNGGSINSSGADVAGAGAAGTGGTIDLVAQQTLENTGKLDAHGGRSDSDRGGSGGDIYLRAVNGSIYNSRNLVNHGGEGTAGGHGGAIQLMSSYGNGIRNSGRLQNYGGLGLSDAGGSAGQILMNTQGGAIYSSGFIDAYGGDTRQTASNGGSGDVIMFNTSFTTTTLAAPLAIAAGPSIPLDQLDIRLSGDINTSGGDSPAGGSGSGGSGGMIQIMQIGPIRGDTRTEPVVELLGYKAIDARGGDGNQGGTGGPVDWRMFTGVSLTGTPLPGGDIVNEAAITTRGGDVDPASTGPGEGGGGGPVFFQGITEFTFPFDDDEESLVNRGDIDASSGDSLNSINSSAMAAIVSLYNRGPVTNRGGIDCSGGDDLATDKGADGYGHGAGPIQLLSMSQVVNSGVLNSNGGNGEYLGGNGQGVRLAGTLVDNSAAINATGGNANADVPGSAGGNGGGVELISPDDYMAVFNSAAVDVSAGEGESAGDPGYDLEGGICLSGDCIPTNPVVIIP
jgi:hypothetical protein